jgi:hypothetical protein
MQRHIIVTSIGLCALGLSAACEKTPTEPSSNEPRLAAPAPSAPRPAVPIPGMPPGFAIDGGEQRVGHATVGAELPKLKVLGKVGEQLEGDVYFFKTLSVKQCEGSPAAGGNAKIKPLVIGAEVEIKAKRQLNISPRDVRLGSGGVVFYASVDPQRQEKGCEPMIRHGSLGAEQVIRGYVVFDVPPPEPPKLQLTYAPTRWGGAGSVVTTLDRCVSCGGQPTAAK